MIMRLNLTFVNKIDMVRRTLHRCSTTQLRSLHSTLFLTNYCPPCKVDSVIYNNSFIRQKYNNSFLRCWNCGIESKFPLELFCEKCTVLQKLPSTSNYFLIFGLEESFDIDLKGLRRKYRKLQSILHPDKYTKRSSEEQEISAQWSALLNKAHNNLQNPVSRGFHLLKLKGKSINEGTTVNEPSFLADIMERNEEIEEAKSSEELLQLYEKNKTVLDQLSEDISKSFKNNDLKGAKEYLMKMKYFISIDTQIKTIFRNQGIMK